MAGTQASRQRLYRELGQLLSQESVDELMEAIPPVGWGDVARRQDLSSLDLALRAEVAELRGETRSEIAAVRAEMRTDFAAVRGEMATEFAAVRTEMATEFAAVRTEMASLRSELTTAMRMQTFSIIGAMFTLAGLTWAATSIV